MESHPDPDVEAGATGDVASDDKRKPDVPSGMNRGGYGSVESDSGSSDEMSPRESPRTHMKRNAKESTCSYAFRVAEPVVFWTVCSAIAAFSTMSMIRITSSPDYPSTLPEGHDGRTLQVGTVANSTEAVNLYTGCETTVGGDTLRDDKGTRRFPDFLIAGSAGAPSNELAALLDEKNVACAGRLERELLDKGDALRDTLQGEDTLDTVSTKETHSTNEQEGAFPTGVVTLGADIRWSPKRSRYVVTSAPNADWRVKSGLESKTETMDYSKSSDTTGDTTTSNSTSKLAWSPSTRFPSTDDGGAFFTSTKWRRIPIPLEAQKEYVDAHFHRCGELEKYLGVPRFQNADRFLYTGWGSQRACEAMGGGETRVVAILSNPVDHAFDVFATELEPFKESVEKWASVLETEPELGAHTSTDEKSTSDESTTPTLPVTYSRAGFRTAVTVDLAIAQTCGSDGLLLAQSDKNFSEKQKCCADVASGLGYSSWPGCPGGCSDALAQGERSNCDSGAGELGFSPVRSGSWVDLLRRMYRNVPAANVMVVTSDQAKRSGTPTLAVAVVEWRLLGLPLVDPVSVTVDLMRVQAKQAAGVGERNEHELDQTKYTAPATMGNKSFGDKTKTFFEKALAILFATGIEKSDKSSGGSHSTFDSAKTGQFPFPALYQETYDRYVSELPKGWPKGKGGDDSLKVPNDLAKKICAYHKTKIVELNSLLGNGEIKFWDEDGTLTAALQGDSLLEHNFGNRESPSAATGMTPFVSLVKKDY